jgi:hypothetical protein
MASSGNRLIANGWQDFQIAEPINPKSIVLNAVFGSNNGNFVRSLNALQATWAASPVAFTGNNTQVVSLDTTDQATIVNAGQWTFDHQMVNASANIPPILNNTVFLRSQGRIYQNQIELGLGGSTYNNVQLTPFQNLATSGQFLNSATGSVPVISFGSGYTGNVILKISLRMTGVFQMALIMQQGAGSWSAFPMRWIVLP